MANLDHKWPKISWLISKAPNFLIRIQSQLPRLNLMTNFTSNSTKEMLKLTNPAYTKPHVKEDSPHWWTRFGILLKNH